MNAPVEASLATLILSIAHSAKMAIGDIEGPETKSQEQDLKMAQFNIDLLSVLKTKTKNNLENQEQQLLDSILGDLQMSFIQASNQAVPNQAKHESNAQNESSEYNSQK